MSKFPENSEFLIIDRLIHGCTNPGCKKKLMLKGENITLKDCLEILREQEAIDIKSQTSPKICQYCGNQFHPRYRCPARQATCNFCNETGLCEQVCRSKQIYPSVQKKSQHLIETDSTSDTDYESEDVYTLLTSKKLQIKSSKKPLQM